MQRIFKDHVEGPCCACGRWRCLSVVLNLHYYAPVRGTGWGCAVCRPAHDGALALVCNPCATAGLPPLQAVRGELTCDARLPISQLVRLPNHDAAAHRWYEAWVSAGMEPYQTIIVFGEPIQMWLIPQKGEGYAL